MAFYDFPYLGNFIIPTDELIIFRGVGIPPTRQTWNSPLGKWSPQLNYRKMGHRILQETGGLNLVCRYCQGNRPHDAKGYLKFCALESLEGGPRGTRVGH